MIEPPFRAVLVSPVGQAPLTATGLLAAGETAIALSAITVLADPEHRVASNAEANPLTKNHLAMKTHVRRRAGLDNGGRS